MTRRTRVITLLVAAAFLVVVAVLLAWPDPPARGASSSYIPSPGASPTISPP